MSGLMEWQKYSDALQVISLGAGRQSSVMYLMAVAGEIKPMPDVAIFADTGNEPAHVYSQVQYLDQFSDVIPIEIVDNGNIYDDSQKALNGINPWGKGRWVGPPIFSDGGGPIRRKCTQQYKIKPKENKIRELLKVQGKQFVIDWRGHTTSEVHRAKPDKRNYYIVRWPLLELRMSDHDVMLWAEKRGHPRFEWSACLICPFRLREHDTAKKIQDRYPASWQLITDMDEQIRDMSQFNLERAHYFNADYLPMTEFVNQDRDNGQMALFDCDGGACGL